MKKVYRQSIWKCLPLPLFLVFLAIFLIVTSFGEREIDFRSWVRFYILGPCGIVVAFIIFQLLRNTLIIITEDFIVLTAELKLGKFNLFKRESTQIKWEDIIAIYMITIPLVAFKDFLERKSFFIFPKADVGDAQQNEIINHEVKKDKRSKKTKWYAKWLLNNKKGIQIPKGTKNLHELLKEIYKRAPYAVIDEDVKKLIEK